MLDIKWIRENADLVQKGAEAKGFKADVKTLLELDAAIRPQQSQLESLQAQRNQISKTIGKADPSERSRLKEQVLEIKQQMESLQENLRQQKQRLDELMLTIPQPARADVPVGKDDQDNVEIKKWGKLPNFDFKAQDHIALGEKLGILDFERGVKLSGTRSYVLKGDGAILEQALLRFAYDKLIQKGFKPMAVPVLVKEEAMEGTGYFPVGRDQAYYIEKDQLALVGTSEVPLCSLHTGEILQQEQLPIRYMASSTCFRREAGTYGKDTRGLYRVHQFQKIEMVIIGEADKEKTDQYHQQLLETSEEILQDLGLAYRVVYVCTGDLGQGQVRKHDIETWMPSRQSYGETHSCSSFYDFQARRLQMRYRDADGKKHMAYTLNNTAIATPRVILALLENFQDANGHIQIPKCLQAYMGGKSSIS